MNERAYLVGFLTTTAVLLVEHLACANRIVPTGDPLDWRLFARYVLGVLGILAGCAATRTLNPLSLIHISEPTRLRRISYAVAQVRRYDWRVKVLRATKDGKEARA